MNEPVVIGLGLVMEIEKPKKKVSLSLVIILAVIIPLVGVILIISFPQLYWKLLIPFAVSGSSAVYLSSRSLDLENQFRDADITGFIAYETVSAVFLAEFGLSAAIASMIIVQHPEKIYFNFSPLRYVL